MTNPWHANEHFESLISGGRTLVSKDRLWKIYQYSHTVQTLLGDVAEFGVYKGGTLKMLAGIFPEDNIYAFDTFEGIPFSGEFDNHHKQGDFSDTDLDSVKAFVGSPNVIYHKGLFSEFMRFDDERKYKFVHVDCDVYSSVIEACLYFTPRMVPGGVIIFDDYGFPTCLGARKAVDSFFKDCRSLARLPTGQAVFVA
jgi:O-methyltransferase